MPLEAVVLCGEIITLRAATIIFLIIIGLPEIVWAIFGCAGCRGNFYRFPGSFNVVGGDLGRLFCWGISVPVFQNEFQGVVEVLDRFQEVDNSLIAFPANQEFVLVVQAALIEYLLCFPFFCIVDYHGCWFVHSAGLESIRIALSIFCLGGDVEVEFLASHSGWEM